MPELLDPTPAPQPGRSGNFLTVDDAEQALASAGVLLSHLEPSHDRASQYMHPGYRAVACGVCGLPTIVGREANDANDATCGRLACQTAAKAEPHAGEPTH